MCKLCLHRHYLNRPHIWDDRREGRCPGGPHKPVTRVTLGQRNSDVAWHRRRSALLDRYPNCAHCGSPATDVDHVIPRAAGGPDNYNNLQTLCHSCHSIKTIRETIRIVTRNPRANADRQRRYRERQKADASARNVPTAVTLQGGTVARNANAQRQQRYRERQKEAKC